MIPDQITIDGRSGTVVYLDNNWHPCTPGQAVMAKVVFFDGGTAFFMAQDSTQKREYVRDAGGRFAETGGRQLQGDEEEEAEKARTFFHGTTDVRLADILKQGLLTGHAGEVWPGFSQRDSVYMTADEDDAQTWAIKTAERTESLNKDTPAPAVAILTIRIPDEYLRDLIPDRHFVTDNPSTPARQFKGNIPPSWIVGAKIGHLSDDAGTFEDFTWKKIKIKKAEGGQIIYVALVLQPIAPAAGVGGITRKFDEAKHPRDKDGRFAEATQPRIFNRPSEVVKDVSWGETSWRWVDKETGKPSGRLLTGEPVAREQLPPVLYHVTTNAPAVESSGVLLGQQGDTGLGGGQAEGVSFTSSREDATVIQRELRRAVQIAKGEITVDDIERFAREDEKEAGLPEGALKDAVQFAVEQSYRANEFTLKNTFVWDEKLPEDKRGYVGPPHPPEEYERLRRSLVKDAFNAYLQIRGHADVPLLKNPILFGWQEHLAKLNPENIQILETSPEEIPAGALVTTGSDKFLHEVRVYADVPRRLKKVAFDEAKHPREPGGTTEGGRFAETGRSGVPTPDPVLAKQAKDGIAAVGKLLPEAVQTANYSGVPDIWEELSAATHEKVRQNFEERSYDYQSAHLDTYDLDQQVSIDIEMRQRTAILDEAKKRLKAQYADVVNPETITHNPKYLDEVGETALNWGDLRRSDLADTTTPVTGLLLKDIQQSWREEYADALKKQIEKYKDSDEYLAQREKLVLERIAEQWENLEPERKIEIATEMRMHGALPGDVWENMRREPEQWVTGVETGSHDDVNYGRTHAIALKLAEMRTNEIRKERGLLEPGQRPKPIYRVVDQSVDKGPLKKQNFVAYDDATGLPIAASNTKEHAERNAEAWAIEQQNLPVVSTQQMIGDIWDAWKRDSSSGLGASLQLAAAIELGGHHRMTPDEVVSARQTAEAYGGMANLQAYVRAQWEVTQMVMEKAKQDKISVYRGLMLPGKQVNSTVRVYVDKLGDPIKPPTDIETGISITSGKPFVRFKFGGEQFVVEKERMPAKSITEVEWTAWHQVDEATKAKVLELWQADAKSVGLVKGVSEAEAKKVTDNLYTRLGDPSRFDLYTSYVERGRIAPRVVSARAYESDEAAVSRRLEKYLHEDIDRGRVFTQLPQLALKRAGAQSTTGTRGVANGWGGVGNLPEDPTRVVLRIEAPSTSILSLPVYGQNAQEEHETVIMGTNDKWLWDAWRDRAPDFASQSVAHKAETTPLEIDLQAEDRGKPHWMSDVDWAKVEAEEAKEKP